MTLRSALLVAAALSCAAAVAQQPAPSASSSQTWTVHTEWVRAHEDFLASDALAGRGSATRDEQIAATYVASRFESYGLQHAPGMASYIQAAGWGTTPTYHRPDDDIDHLDIDFMTAAIQSLVEPVRWLASSDFRPAWNAGGKPERGR